MGNTLIIDMDSVLSGIVKNLHKAHLDISIPRVMDIIEENVMDIGDVVCCGTEHGISYYRELLSDLNIDIIVNSPVLDYISPSNEINSNARVISVISNVDMFDISKMLADNATEGTIIDYNIVLFEGIQSVYDKVHKFLNIDQLLGNAIGRNGS